MNATATPSYYNKPRAGYGYRTSNPRSAPQESRKSPVREEIEKCLGTYDIQATFTEDTQTLELLKRHAPNIVAFLCTLKRGNEILSLGRGSATFNQYGRYLGRTIKSAFGASLVDGIVRASKIDALLPDTIGKSPSGSMSATEAYRASEPVSSFESATDAQKSYLHQLISSLSDEEERARWEGQVASFSKEDASLAIQSLKSS